MQSAWGLGVPGLKTHNLALASSLLLAGTEIRCGIHNILDKILAVGLACSSKQEMRLHCPSTLSDTSVCEEQRQCLAGRHRYGTL